MNYIVWCSAALLALAWDQNSRAGCPDLPTTDMAYYLCPGIGAYNPLPHTTIVYQRPKDFSVGGICSNLKNAIGKAYDKDTHKTYKGQEFDKVEGLLVCDYTLPEDWKEKASIKEFKLTSKIKKPPLLDAAVCPILTFTNVSDMLCGEEIHSLDGVEWKVEKKSIGDAVCKFFKGMKNNFVKAPEGVIHGQITEGTKAFKHTCKYKYQDGTKTLTLHGVMSLDLLKIANKEIAKK